MVKKVDNELEDVKVEYTLKEMFNNINGEFKEINRKFDKVDQKFDKVDQKFDKVDQKFDDINRKFDAVNKKIDTKFNYQTILIVLIPVILSLLSHFGGFK
jgi:septation ring formation regulator EzrA